MATPQRDPKSGIWHVRQRTPRDVIDRLRRSEITVPIGDGSYATIVIGDIVRISLRTKDDRTAKHRHAIVDAALRTIWDRARQGVSPPSLGMPSTQSLPKRAPRPMGPSGGMTWDEAVERFGPGMGDLLNSIGVAPTEANQAAVIAETASVMDEAFALLRAKVGVPTSPSVITLKASRHQAAAPPAVSNYVTIDQLWKQYRTYHEDKLASNTLHRYGASIARLAVYMSDRDVRKISDDDLYAWAEHRRDDENIAPATVNSNDIVAASSLFAWAMRREGGKILKQNPAVGIRLDVPRKTDVRERHFRDAEISAILRAALSVNPIGARDVNNQAKRWCPWLAAYSGARISELTALTAEDIRQEQGAWIMYIDNTKNYLEPRSVPIHDHIIEQGFLQFVRLVGSGPLFYDPTEHKIGARTPPFEIRSRKVADWVRKVSGLPMAVDPNHGWRHTFKTLATGLIDPRIRDEIVGHAPGSTARKYERPPIRMMAEALRTFPRYAV